MSAKRIGTLMVIFAVAAMLCSALAKAAEDQAGEIKGTITLNGNPLPGGRIILFPAREDDQFVGAKIKAGTYKLSRVPAGEYRVAVEFKDLDPKYASEDTSPLRVVVRPGSNEIDFALKSR